MKISPTDEKSIGSAKVSPRFLGRVLAEAYLLPLVLPWLWLLAFVCRQPYLLHMPTGTVPGICSTALNFRRLIESRCLVFKRLEKKILSCSYQEKQPRETQTLKTLKSLQKPREHRP